MTLLSLFDYSGQWSQPFYDNGWQVIQVDLKFGNLHDLLTWDSVEYVFEELGIHEVDGIIAAVPCTDYAASGAQWWPNKAESLLLSNTLTAKVLALVDLFEATDPDWAEENPDQPWFWAIENPVGRLPKEFPVLGKGWFFDPYQYAGYGITKADLQKLSQIRAKDGIDVTAEERQFIINTGAYTKKTGLWGSFRYPNRLEVEPVKGSKWGTPLMSVGGKSAKTKEFRSNTPTGFAQAFYEANKNFNSLLPAQEGEKAQRVNLRYETIHPR